jgi:Ca2+-binding RTX toxin-like protein
MRGGAGADTFVFRTAAQMPITDADMIRDFKAGKDTIDLSTIMADTESGGLAWLGTDGFTGAGGEVRIIEGPKGTQVRVDLDGDGIADAGIFLQDAQGITASDFLL